MNVKPKPNKSNIKSDIKYRVVPDAPKCKALEHIRKYQNKDYTDQTNDPYHWLTDKSNPEVIEYLKSENNYTNSVMQDTKDLQNKLFIEFKSRIQETDSSAQWPHDEYYYYFNTIENQEYGIFCRTKNSDKLEEVLLDENILAKEHEFFSIGDLEISPCHNYLAYTADTTGDEKYSLYIKDLKNNKIIDLTKIANIKEISPGIVWTADGKNLLYLNLDQNQRPFEIWVYSFAEYLNNNKNLTYKIFTESDERFWLGIDISRSKSYLFICAESKLSTEIYYLPADNLDNLYNSNKDFSENIKSIKPREQHVEYDVEHYIDLETNKKSNNKSDKNYFYILINSKSKPNYELYKADINNSGNSKNLDFKNWQLLIKHSENITLESLDCFQDYGILFTRENGISNLKIVNNYDFNNIINLDIKSKLNEEIYDISPAHNEMYKYNKYRFQYESLSTPHSVYNLIINNNNFKLELIKQDTVLNNYDKNNYISERILVEVPSNNSKDNKNKIKIPVSIVYNKHKYKKDGEHPLLLYGYGSYGISIDPYFSYCRLSLLDRGIAFAIAHIRGGGDLGETWHHKGRLDCKTNTFDDFISSAEYLINNKYTSNKKLIIQGGSAGGLLIGNVINQRPELFNIAIAEVPFVDCLNTMLDPDLPLTVTEYEEWGNPSDSTQVYKYIKSYAPYENISAQKYPNLLINNSLEDTRVSYWEAAKWTAKLRENKQDNNILLLKTLMAAGHGGMSGRYQALHDVAFNYSFILKIMKTADNRG